MKSDVWSLGISLIELALGAFPFTDPPDDDDLSDLEDYAGNQQKTPTHRDSFIVSHKTAKRASKRRSKLEFQPDGGLTTMSIIELMHQIVQEPSPRLPEGKFPKEAEDLVDACLLKIPEERPAPKTLLVCIPFEMNPQASTDRSCVCRITRGLKQYARRVSIFVHGQAPFEDLPSH